MREPPPSRPMWVAVGGGSQSWCGEKLTTTESRPAPLGSDSRPTRTGQSLCASVTNEREETTMHNHIADALQVGLSENWIVGILSTIDGEQAVMVSDRDNGTVYQITVTQLA